MYHDDQSTYTIDDDSASNAADPHIHRKNPITGMLPSFLFRIYICVQQHESMNTISYQIKSFLRKYR